MDERRTGWVLIVVLVGQLVYLAIQGRAGRRDAARRGSACACWGRWPTAWPRSPSSSRGAREGVKLRGTLLEENQQLRREVADLRLRLLRLTDVEGELLRLGDAVRYPTPPAGRIRAVDVVYADHTSWLRTLILYTGDGGGAGQPAGALARRPGRPGGRRRRPLRQGAADHRPRRGGRRHDPAHPPPGGGARRPGAAGLELDYVPLQADVRPGDRVLTAGIDGIYPRGIPIGTVAPSSRAGSSSTASSVAPAVDFGTLDQVYLLDYRADAADASKRPAPVTALSCSPRIALAALVHFVGVRALRRSSRAAVDVFLVVVALHGLRGNSLVGAAGRPAGRPAPGHADRRPLRPVRLR